MKSMIPERDVAAEGKNSLRIRAGIIESVWRPGSLVDVEDARDAMLAVERISGGIPMPMLSEMTDVEITAAARYEFARTTGVLAIAVLGIQCRRPGHRGRHEPAHPLPARILYFQERRPDLADGRHQGGAAGPLNRC